MTEMTDIKTEEQLMEWIGSEAYPAGHFRSYAPAVDLPTLRELFTGKKLVPSDAVVLTREEAARLSEGYHAAVSDALNSGLGVMRIDPTELYPAPPKPKQLHDSDCAQHNMPAYSNGQCNCSLSKEQTHEKP